MNAGERILLVRKKLDMTMEKFGEQIGITKSAVSNIEKGNRSVTDQVAKAICREFNVNEDWLRYGEGEMFEPRTRSEIIAQFAGELMKEEDSSFRKQLVEVLAELDLQEWKLLEGIAKKLAKKTRLSPSPAFL